MVGGCRARDAPLVTGRRVGPFKGRDGTRWRSEAPAGTDDAYPAADKGCVFSPQEEGQPRGITCRA
jgi:hypothetical protein